MNIPTIAQTSTAPVRFPSPSRDVDRAGPDRDGDSDDKVAASRAPTSPGVGALLDKTA